MNLADYTFRKQIRLHHRQASEINNNQTHNSAEKAHKKKKWKKTKNCLNYKTEQLCLPPCGFPPFENEKHAVIRVDNIKHRKNLLTYSILKSPYKVKETAELRLTVFMALI